MFECAPSTLLTRFAEELRRAGALLLLTFRIPGPDSGRGRDAPRVRGTSLRVDAEGQGRLITAD